MKKVMGVCAFLLLVCAFLLPAQAAEYNLMMGLTIPPAHSRWVKVYKPWIEELEQRSGGRIKIEPYFADSLFKAKECFDAVKNGLADIGEASYGASAGQFPFHECVAGMLDVNRSLDDQTGILHDIEKRYPVVMKELDGTRLLFSSCMQVGQLVGTVRPIHSLDELRGLKINALGGGVGVLERMEALGISPVYIPVGDVYMALQQGIIDGCLVDFQVLVNRRFGDLIKYVVPLSISGNAFYTIMNQDVYDSMPEDLKKIVDEMCADMDRRLAEFWSEDEYSALEVWKEKMGGSITPLSEEDFARALELTRPVDAVISSKLDARGFPGAEIMAAWKELEQSRHPLWKDSRLFREYVK